MSDGLKDALTLSAKIDTDGCVSAGKITSHGKICKCAISMMAGEVTIIDNNPAGLEQGTKYDQSKIPVELLPTQALEEVAKVLGFGRNKYDSWNWAKGFKWTRLIGAALRHLYAYSRGEDKDPESGLSHLSHCACCVLFLLQHEISNLGEDDRFKGFIKK